LGTFSAILPKNQVIKHVVYKTNLIERKIENCQIYIFTSPSNLDAFLTINKIPDDAKVIVWGKSTEHQLLIKGGQPHFVLNKSIFLELIEVLKSIN
jgi:uroporphyrinogen-III synthase